MPKAASRHAPPSRRLGRELTTVSTNPPRCSAASHLSTRHAAQRHLLSRGYRFHYHRQREAIVAAQIQAAESPKNSGRFKQSVGER